LQLNTIVTPATLNEFRFQWAREDRPRLYNGPNIPGQSRPFPDTGIDFVGQYRFGEPFFIPTQDHDTRVQVNDNFSLIRGAHSFKSGAEMNRTATSQIFIGFANGRYIFDSISGFENYVTYGPRFVECANGSTSTVGVCPGGPQNITGPLIFFAQFAGVNGLSVEQAGAQTLAQWEPALFAQDRWQIRRNLTLSTDCGGMRRSSLTRLLRQTRYSLLRSLIGRGFRPPATFLPRGNSFSPGSA
jgi:hypothetical protein